MAGAEDYGNDLAQILFDGSGGVGYTHGGSGSSTVTINGNAQIIAENLADFGYIYTETPYFNDVGQILFDGTPGLNYAGGGSGSSHATIGGSARLSAINAQTITNDEYSNDVGQIIFDGSGGFSNAVATGSGVTVVIQENALLNATNTFAATLQGGYGNNCGQVIFDGSGGFQYDYPGSGSAQITLQNAAQVTATNAGLLVSNTSSSNNVAQILFDGSGGASAGSGSTGQGTGLCNVTIQDTVSLQATNSGTLGNTSSNTSINNIGQIVVDGGGGLNSYGGGAGHLTATISSSMPITAINESGGTISNIDSSVSNKIGQIIFDGSQGSVGSFPSSGDLSVTLSGTASVSASNSGTISTAGTAQGMGQIIFDGSGGTCTLQLGGGSTIAALNTASGSVQGDQIAFHNTVVQGTGTVLATNQGGSIVHGVAFYGPATSASNLNVQLSGSSLWVDSTVSSSFAIGSLSGDPSSTATINHACTINTPYGVVTTFAGNVGGSGSVTVVGSGQQIFSGTNSYTGATTVNTGILTLRGSNIPGTLSVGSGAAFTGTGVVSGASTIHGTIKPGHSPGTLTFLSGLTLTETATTQIEIDATQASLLAVTGGNATLGGTLQILEDPGARVGNTFPIVTTSGGHVIGVFSGLTSSGPFIPVVVYEADAVTLTLQNSPFNFAALLQAPDRLLRNIETLKHLDTRRHDTIKALKRPSNNTKTAKTKKLWFRSNKTPQKTQDAWSFYVEPTGSFGRVKSRKNVFGNNYQTAGLRSGFDYLWGYNHRPNASAYFGLGLIAEYNHLWGKLYNQAGKFGSDGAYASVYTTIVPKAVPEISMNLIGGGGYNSYTFHRYPLGSSSLQASGHTEGAQADALFDIEYTFQHERFGSLPENFYMTPMGALQYTYAHIDGYKEKGAGIYDLKVGHQTTQTLSSLVGFRTGYLFLADSSVTVRPELLMGWQYQCLDSSIKTSWAPLPILGPSETSFTIPGFAANNLIAGADLRIEIKEHHMVQFNYDLWYNTDALNNFFLLEYKLKF